MRKIELLSKDITLGFYNEMGILSIPISQYDVDRIIAISFTNDGKRFQIPDDTSVYLKALKSDGTQINTDEYCKVHDGKVEIQVFKQLSVVPGTVKCEMILSDSDGKQYTSSHFNIVVTPSVHNDENLRSSNEYKNIIDILLEIKSLKEDLLFKKDKDVAGGVPSLDENAKIPRNEIYDADLDNKGIVKLVDSIENDSVTDAATSNSVKQVNDKIIAETNRASTAEKNLDTKKVDKTTVAKEDTLGMIKSGTDITVDDSGNVSVNDNSHNHTVANITDIAEFVQESVSNHNTSSIAHNDIRDTIADLTTRLNALADSDDITLDQLSEIVAYIKNNKTLIDGITTSKVNVSDIIDNLISTAIDKPLSAHQGRILKETIDSLTKNDIGLSEVENKSSDTIRSEITKENIINALGYTPPEANENTWQQNAKEQDGYVTAGNGHSEEYWGTDTEGNPSWRKINAPEYSIATESSSGLMSADDKKKLDGIVENANNYVLPITANDILGGIKTGYVQNGTRDYPVKTDELGNAFVEVPWEDTNTTYEDATVSKSGLMSGADKTTLNNLSVKMDSFEAAKSEIVSSTLGQSLGLTSNSTIAEVATAIDGYIPSTGKPTWKNTSNGSYKFAQSGDRWIANNRGISSSTASSTWKATVSSTTTAYIGWRTATESSYDKLSITLNGSTILSAKSGLQSSEQSLTVNLVAGENTLVATYTKDGSGDSYGDIAYVILPAIGDQPGQYKYQSKSVTPGSSSQTIYPGTGYDGFYSVTVGAAQSSSPTNSLYSGSAYVSSNTSTSGSMSKTPSIFFFLFDGSGLKITVVYKNSTYYGLYKSFSSPPSWISISGSSFTFKPASNWGSGYMYWWYQ